MSNYSINKFNLFFLLLMLSIPAVGQNTITEEFTLKANDSLQLAGDIMYPSTPGKYPAAILIWGSGPHTRDETISGNPIFKQLADVLVAEGMIVLRMDKRGYGKSSGNFLSEDNYTTLDLANDVQLAFNFLEKHKAVDTTRMGLIGHSEGSIIASMIAAKNQRVNWVIVFGPSGVSGKEIELEQRRMIQQRSGITSEISAKLASVWDRYIEFIKNGYQDQATYYEIGKEFLLAHGLPEDDERINKEFIDQILGGFKTRWHQYFYTNDNAHHIEKIQVPYLAIFGGEDEQTSVHLNFSPVYEALKRAGNTRYKMVVLADEDHFFLRHEGKRMDEHVFGAMKLSKQFVETIKVWLQTEEITNSKK